MNRYICMGTKPGTNDSSCETVSAISARDAYLAFTKNGHVLNVSIIPVTVEKGDD